MSAGVSKCNSRCAAGDAVGAQASICSKVFAQCFSIVVVIAYLSTCDCTTIHVCKAQIFLQHIHIREHTCVHAFVCLY